MIKLKTEDYEQMLDRLKVISNVVDNNLQQHSVAKIHTDIKDHIAKANDELLKAALITQTIYNKMVMDNIKDPDESDYDDIENSEYDSISIPKPREYNDDDYDY
jgi:hypothetical protein|tara:strand:- start:1182 stop:1493 length:312 start_codon:yes stop_codon:yes gene_type:complete